MRRWAGIAAVLAGALALAACSAAPAQPGPSASSPEPPPPGVEVERDIVYKLVDTTALALDAYLPEERTGAPLPAIIVVHGGGFTGGSKAAPDAAPVAGLMAQNGYAAFSVDYRKVPDSVFPAPLEDLQSAVAWLREPAQAERFGIDPARIGAFGGSAGAILVSEAGTAGEGPLDQGSRLRAVVELSGVMDFTADALSPEIGSDDVRRGLAYLGCTDPLDCPVAEEASALYHVDPTDPPFYLAHSIDEDLPEQSTVALAEALEEAGVPVVLDLRPGSDHTISMMDDAMVDRILAFYTEHL